MVEHDDSLVDAISPEEASEEEASEEELAESARLRDALDGKAETADADLLRAVSLAHAPHALPPAENERLVERAIATARPARRATVVRVMFAFSGVAAIAATALMYLSTQASVARPPPLVAVRSTQALFDKPFDSRGSGSASARIDRIALAREGDLRENRFAKWGVR